MSANTMNRMVRGTIFALGLGASAVCFAHGGGGGAWHGGGGAWHGGGGGWHGHGGGWYGSGYYNGGGWGPGVIIGVPFGGYYSDDCETIRVCNPYGHCWLEQSCS
jgi:hypothetical protein